MFVGFGMGMGVVFGIVGFLLIVELFIVVYLVGYICVNIEMLILSVQDNINFIDNFEIVYILFFVFFKMFCYGCVGVFMEVMGLMLGEFVDDFIVCVVDVFVMFQSGIGVSVEVVDLVFQIKMMDMFW